MPAWTSRCCRTSSATPEALVAAGQAECGISFQDAMTFATAAGAPLVSVMAILQHTAQEIAVLESSAIKRPRDLDGKTYAGFGYPNEDPTLKAVIKADGGTGDFTTVTLDTAAYEALYAKRADFVITFSAWEGIEAGQRGIPLRTFAFTDYGFPDFYQVVLACDRRWLDREPDLAKAFVSASARGFEFAADHPDDAAAILVAQNPGVFDGSPDLPAASQRFLADGGFLRDAQGAVGRQTLERWQGYSGFLSTRGCSPTPTASRWPPRPTTPRCSRTRTCRDRPGRPPATMAATRAPRPGAGRPLGGLRPAGRAGPRHAAGPVARCSRRSGTSGPPPRRT